MARAWGFLKYLCWNIISCNELGCLKQASSWRLNITMPSRQASHLLVLWRRIPETCIPSLQMT